MFTILWKTPGGGEELYCAPSVAKIPAAPELSDQLDCRGREHIAFQRLTAVDDDSSNLHLVRTVIDGGEVFVMNAEGKTVAMYRFVPEQRVTLKAA